MARKKINGDSKIKVIQISSASHSFSMKDYEQDIFMGWYARVAFQLKKFHPEVEVECWTPERKHKKEGIKEKQGIKFRIFPTNLSIRHGVEISLPMIKALKQEIKNAERERIKLVLHFHEYHSLQVYLMLLVRKRKAKIVAQHHGGRSPFGNLKKHKKLVLVFMSIKILQFLENLSLKKVDLFYALSDEEINYLKSKTKAEARFQTMGVEDEYFEKVGKEKARGKLKLNKKKYVLYIGRIKKTKGMGELLDAMKKLPDVELLVMGEGIDKDIKKYQGYVKQNKMKNIRFLGLIYGKEKLLYLSACDCLILPSYTEGAPVVVMEAIARNLPVIATDVGGIKKMIGDSREGIIIKDKSSGEIVKAVKEVLKWGEKEIRKYAEKYKWEGIIEKTFEEYGR